ncbi:hypothetical protein ACHHYP_14305 [Achlya hypogyna]|uniref:WD40 repeat-like protein n=1 Tax=Achlya hypogyna TaxID=1202772 RepID=A0A1V9YDG9_ACHHY|nr:hypothetical protein ACHHYP_14305 [Achlya hypogyna]
MQGVVIEELAQVVHSSTINSFCYNDRFNRFAIADERSIKLWHQEGEIRTVNLPQRTSYLVQTIEFIASRNLYVASCLDGTLRFYDEHMNELASVFTHRATILCLVFDEPRQRIITGGIDGCGAWVLRGKDWDGYEHEGQTMRNPAYQVAPLDCFSKTGAAWVQRVKLDGDRVLFLSNNSIHVFTLHDNAHVETYKKLVKAINGAITDFVIYKQKAIVVGCMDGSIYIATIYPRTTLAVFKDHSKPITALAFDDVSQSIFSASLDGTIRMWDMDLLRNIHQIRMDAPVAGLFLVPKTNPVVFAVQSRQAMRLLLLKYTLKEHSTTASPLAILYRFVAPGKKPRPAATKAARPSVSRRKVSQIPIHLMVQEMPAAPDDTLEEEPVQESHVISICQDRSVRIFASETLTTPSATWTPDEAVLQDVIGFAYNPYAELLYVLLKHQILVFDVVEDITTPLRTVDIENRVVKAITSALVAPHFHLQSRRTAGHRRSAISNRSRSEFSLTQSILEAEMNVTWLVCGTDKGELLFSSSLHSSLDEALLQTGHAACITYLSFTSSATAVLVSFAQDKTLGIWRLAPRMTRLAMLTLGEAPSCMAVAPTSQLMACGFEDGRVDFIDFAYPEPKHIASEVNHSSLVIAADFSDDLHLCVTTSFDMSIKVWDQSKNLLREVQMSSPLSCMCFANPQGDLFVAILEKLYTLVAADVLPAKLPSKRVVEVLPPPTPVPAHPMEPIVDPHTAEELSSGHGEGNQDDSIKAEPRAITTPVTAHGKHRRSVQPIIATDVSVCSPPVLRPTKPITPSSTARPETFVSDSQVGDKAQAGSEGEAATALPALLVQPHYDMRQTQMRASSLARGLGKREHLRPSVPVQTKHAAPKSVISPAIPSSERRCRKPPARARDSAELLTPIAPVFHDNHPPLVQRTPRKLWNAIGAEDRRLIVLQRKPS